MIPGAVGDVAADTVVGVGTGPADVRLEPLDDIVGGAVDPGLTLVPGVDDPFTAATCGVVPEAGVTAGDVCVTLRQTRWQNAAASVDDVMLKTCVCIVGVDVVNGVVDVVVVVVVVTCKIVDLVGMMTGAGAVGLVIPDRGVVDVGPVVVVVGVVVIVGVVVTVVGVAIVVGIVAVVIVGVVVVVELVVELDNKVLFSGNCVKVSHDLATRSFRTELSWL